VYDADGLRGPDEEVVGVGDKVAPQAPQLPKEAPEGLRKFLACLKDEVTLENGTLTWISVSGKDIIPPDLAPVVPDKIMKGTVHPGMAITPDPSAPGKADLKIGVDLPGLGLTGPSIPMSVDNGTLTADTSGLPKALKDPIDAGVKNLNDWFKSKDKGLAPPTFAGGKTTLKKIDLQPPAKTTPAPVPVPGPDVVKPPPPPPPPPVVPPEPQAAGTDWSHLTPTPEQWDKAVREAKDVPAGPKPVVGAGGPGGPKSPAGLGNLAQEYIVGIVIAAVLIAAGFIFVGAPALGLVGAPVAAPTPTPPPVAEATPTPKPEATPTPTPTPTPEGITVRSDDGLATLRVPSGSVPDGTKLSVTAKGQADAPPDLQGVTFRSAFYGVGPAGLTIDPPATFQRLVDVTKLGFDFEAVGYPVIGLAERAGDGMWSWLPNQMSRVGGADGMSPENELVQSASLAKTGDVFGFGGQVFVQLLAYPEAGSRLLIGQPASIAVKASAPSSEGTNDRILAIEPFQSQPGVVQFSAVTLGQPIIGTQTGELTLTCMQLGDLQVGMRIRLAPGVASDLLTRLGLGGPPETDVEFATSIHCVDNLTAAAPHLLGGCVSDIHTPIEGGYPSHLHWRFDFDDSPAPAAGTLLQLVYSEGGPSPLNFGNITITGAKAEFDTGITKYGTKTFDRLMARGPDGTTTDLSSQYVQAFGSSFDVTAAEEALAGNRCAG
jgi:hypothetical protein